MDSDIQKLLEENLRVSKDNNRILRKLRRAQTLGTFFRLLWLAVLVGIPVALYVYVIEPYYQGAQEKLEELQNRVENIPGLEGFLE